IAWEAKRAEVQSQSNSWSFSRADLGSVPDRGFVPDLASVPESAIDSNAGSTPEFDMDLITDPDLKHNVDLTIGSTLESAIDLTTSSSESDLGSENRPDTSSTASSMLDHPPRPASDSATQVDTRNAVNPPLNFTDLPLVTAICV
ncbi:hypothetical protein CEP53_003195, partial [Fusarium sp. AF-6]